MRLRRISSAARLHRPLLLVAGILVLSLIALSIACGGDDETSGSTTAISTPRSSSGSVQVCPPAGSAKSLTAAGATFPFPLYSKWIDEYKKACGVEINYQSIGSGGGIKQITAKTVDYAGSDAIMNQEQTKAAEDAGGPILHIPMTSGSEAIIFNLPGIDKGQLKLSGDVLADIYLKKIKKWNDPKITALNSGVSLSDTDIAVVHRSDGSGTTFIFTNYLSKVSDEWKSSVGSATSVNWPGDIGGEGNEGVANQVRQIPGAIGYVELAYAVKNNLVWASLKNKSGNFLEPSLDATTAAATGVTLPDDMKVLITDSENAGAYLIAGFSWALVFVNQPDKAKGQTLVSYLWWSIHDGQQFSSDLFYAPLSKDAVGKAEAEIKSIKFQGQPLLLGQ